MTGTHKTTILRLIADMGKACQKYHDEHVRNLKCKRVQCDEVWNFCYSKQANIPEAKQGQFGFGDVWTWTAIDADSKLMITWVAGDRSTVAANAFMADVAARLAYRVQLTTDGWRSYPDAVYRAFGCEIDYAMLIKVYGPEKGGAGRYSPPIVLSVHTDIHCGNPDPKHINTSYVERSNLTLRMGMRRATRLTNAFSKKLENHLYMTAIYWTYYNFCRVHMTLKTTPAVKAGLAHKPWSVADLIGLICVPV